MVKYVSSSPPCRLDIIFDLKLVLIILQFTDFTSDIFYSFHHLRAGIFVQLSTELLSR
jgi:hypothetical protein